MLDFVIFAFTAIVGLIIILVFLLPGPGKEESENKESANNNGIPGARKTDEKLGNLGDIAEAGSLHQYLLNLHDKYGPLASFWWNEKLVVSLASPELFKQTSRLFDRPVDLFKMFEPLIGEQSIQYANEEEGKWRRQNYDVSYSHDAVNEMIQTFNKMAETLVNDWRSYPAGDHIPIHQQLVDIAIKTIIHTSFGDFFKNEEEVQLLRQNYNTVWSDMEDRLGGSHPEEGSERMERFTKARQWIHDLVERVVAHREKSTDSFSKFVFIDNLRNLMEVSDPRLSCDAVSFMIGGFHTSGNMLTWGLYFLATHDDVQQKSYEEVESVIGHTGQVTQDGISQLKYLKQVIDETLRTAVVAPWAARYAHEDIELNGYTIPKESSMIHALGVVLQDPEIWPDPEEFDPDRFSPDASKDRHPYAFQPFGFAGKRKCPGYRFSTVEGIVVLAKILQQFKLGFPEGQLVEPVYGLVTSPKEELWITATPRE
ncbi:cytochrome P450 20A1-like [Corticium candelabrum]|uniref:cytochrome P450 20A1-like n=1 Tax=Corticium candelabrum TaxID=121492 RepID=UPI002E2573D1|nr:cytochrome P450 20A1-like [Corticium candelabrum]